MAGAVDERSTDAPGEHPRGAAAAVVAVVEDVTGAGLDELGRRWTVVRDAAAWSDGDRLHELVTGARALVVRNRTQVTAELLRSAPLLEVVARAGVGLDNIDLATADELGVAVVAAVGANARSVGELALALALALARDVAGHDRRVRDNAWARTPGLELEGRTWAVLGLGATGRATAQLAAGVGMRVVAHDPFLDADEPLDGGVLERVDSLEEALAGADVVSLHLAASETTRDMVDAAFLGALRPGALLVNVARGELVDEAALLAALDDGTVGGAALDVRRAEPPGPNPLSDHPRVVSTPHIAGITGAAQDRVVDMIAADVERVLSGSDARHAVGRHRRAAHRS